MNAQQIAEKLDKATRKTNGGWLACCPAHDDSNPSLSLDDSGDKVLINCLAGCPQDSVIEALRDKGLWGSSSTFEIEHPTRGKPHAIWKYRDNAGQVVGYACRFNTATGKDVLPYFKHSEGWRWKAPEAPRPLYNGHKITSDKPVLVVEGEKAADAAQRLLPDYVAVTWQGGCSATSKANWQTLKGCNVTIWPDADAPGKKAAAAIARTLKGIAAAVLIVAPPDVPQGWDLADAEAQGWTPEQVKALITPTTLNRVALLNAADIMPRAIRWIWPGWLAAGKLHILAGAPGTGKSTLAFALAASISTAGRWPDGSPADLGAVAIWSGEDDPADTIVPRLLACGANLDNIKIIGGMTGEDPRPFDPATDLPALRAALQGQNIRLLIVDPVVSAVAGDSHKNTEVRRALQPLVDLAASIDCAVLGISHFTKSSAGKDPIDRVTGSLAFGALARVVMAAAKLPEDEHDGARLLARAKSNIGPDSGGVLYNLEQIAIPGHHEITNTRVTWGKLIEGTARDLLAQAEQNDGEEKSATDEAREWLEDLLSQGAMSAAKIREGAKQAGISRKSLLRAKDKLKITTNKQGFSGGWFWTLPAQESPTITEDDRTQNRGTLGPLGEPPKNPHLHEESQDTLKNCWGSSCVEVEI